MADHVRTLDALDHHVETVFADVFNRRYGESLASDILYDASFLEHRTFLPGAPKHKARAIFEDVRVSTRRQQRSGVPHARQGSCRHATGVDGSAQRRWINRVPSSRLRTWADIAPPEVAHSVVSKRPLRRGAVPRPRALHLDCVLVRSARHFGVGMFSNTSPEVVRMKINLTNRQMPMLCTAAVKNTLCWADPHGARASAGGAASGGSDHRSPRPRPLSHPPSILRLCLQGATYAPRCTDPCQGPA